jgi:magnesium-transporting ATPase (P-type)
MPAEKTDGRLPTEASSNQQRAVQAIILIAAVVLFNLALCVSIFWLVKLDYVRGNFPALVLFLSFALSVGVILITFLGESVDKSINENEWVRKIGVTPIMTIAAVLISLLAAFGPLAKLIVPPPVEIKDPYVGHFMLAKIGVTCSAQNFKGVDRAGLANLNRSISGVSA